jgi:hypothetical protein
MIFLKFSQEDFFKGYKNFEKSTKAFVKITNYKVIAARPSQKLGTNSCAHAIAFFAGWIPSNYDIL